jgi:autotransporter adhesin
LVITDALPATTTGKAVLTGGTAAAGTNMTLNNSGVSFAQNTTGSPVRVTGVANGANTYDAVNMSQLWQLEKTMSRGIASSVATANIPSLEAGKQFAAGVGLGMYNGETSVAFGGTYRFSPIGILKATVGTNVTGGSYTTVGLGAGWSW